MHSAPRGTPPKYLIGLAAALVAFRRFRRFR
jgi:hypothetical protein